MPVCTSPYTYHIHTHPEPSRRLKKTGTTTANSQGQVQASDYPDKMERYEKARHLNLETGSWRPFGEECSIVASIMIYSGFNRVQ